MAVANSPEAATSPAKMDAAGAEAVLLRLYAVDNVIKVMADLTLIRRYPLPLGDDDGSDGELEQEEAAAAAAVAVGGAESKGHLLVFVFERGQIKNVARLSFIGDREEEEEEEEELFCGARVGAVSKEEEEGWGVGSLAAGPKRRKRRKPILILMTTAGCTFACGRVTIVLFSCCIVCNLILKIILVAMLSICELKNIKLISNGRNLMSSYADKMVSRKQSWITIAVLMTWHNFSILSP